MSTRITQRLMVAHSLASLQSGLGRYAAAQERLSTGRLINRPSDSPTGTNDAMRLRAALATGEQHARNAQDGISWLGEADSVLGTMQDSLNRARGLVLQGASTGTASQTARESLATELSSIRAGLIDSANTRHLGRPLFGGTTAGTAAYDASGTYVGDGNAVTRTIGDGVELAVNTTGPDAFSTGDDDLFGVLGTAIDQLRNDPDALSGTLGRIDAVAERMRSAQADIGARYSRVDSATSALSARALDNQTSLSSIENVDVAQAILDVQTQEVAYKAALGATAKTIQPSLLDFLR